MIKNKHPSKSFGDLYPHLNEDQLQEADENLRQYLRVVRSIFEEIEANNPKVLTELRYRARLRKEKRINKRFSTPNLNN